MIWHIFKKDARLLWPFAALAAIIHGLTTAAVSFSNGIDGPFFASIPLAAVSLLMLVILVVSVAQQDRVPGERQDWLIRPINRLHLIAAKLLFIVLLGLAPLCVADVALGVAHRLPFGGVLAASLGRSAALLCFICVPTLIVASITRTLTEFVVTIVAAAVAFIVLFALIPPALGASTAVTASGIAWITGCIWAALSVLPAFILLPLQYLHRRTVQTRWLSAGALVCALLGTIVPWRAGFAIQQHFDAQPGASAPITMEYEPTARVQLVRRGQQTGTEGRLILYTLRVDNLPGGAQLRPEHYTVRMLDSDGKTLYQGESTMLGTIAPETGSLMRQADGASSPVAAVQAVEISPRLPAHSPGQVVRVEIDYSLTLFRAVGEDWIADAGNDQPLGGFARCTTRPRAGTAGLNMVCLSTHPWSACISGYHVEQATGRKVWHFSSCDHVDYAPFAAGIWRDAYFRLGWFGAGQGFSTAAVTTGDPRATANLIETLLPQDHFTRRVVIPQLQLP